MDISLINFHAEEGEFNRLNGRDRLTYLFNRFHVGMEITVKVKDRIEGSGTIYGFYNNSDDVSRIENGKSKSYNNMCVYETVPHCNAFVMIDGKISNYYPLWIYPDFSKIRNEKLESIGI